MDRPIPSFYCCYLLRSKACPRSVYVGSTTNPVRRQNQHNGLKKGGAVRTSRDYLRPWEMVSIVSGFTSHISALQFEWAWQNPHITTHIPRELRIQTTSPRKRSGRPKRPRHSVHSLLSNLHILLRMPYFSRWPLQLHFSSKDVYEDWVKLCKKVTSDQLPEHVKSVTDFTFSSSSSFTSDPKSTEHNLVPDFKTLKIDYSNQKLYIEKAKQIFDFEQEGNCAICEEELKHDQGLYTVCPNLNCLVVNHMTCLSKKFLDRCKDELVPTKGTCTVCKTEILWADVVKELSLRLRGSKEVDDLLKVRKPRKLSSAEPSSKDMLESDDEEESDEFCDINLDNEVSSEVDTASTNTIS